MSNTISAEQASSKRRLTELHVVAARERALRLFCTTSTMFPAEWAAKEIIEQTVIDASEFAYHARRVLDLCAFKGMKFAHVNELRFKQATGQDLTFVSDFRDAVNRLHHIDEAAFNWAIWEGSKVFTTSPDNRVVSFLKVSTDNKPVANISLFGVTMAFLNSVLPAVKAKFPAYQF